MGTSHGTGQPIRFRCSACRRRFGSITGYKVVRTGRTRPKDDGRATRRSLNTEHEYKCLHCGHVGWSRHVDILGKPLKADLPT